MKNVRTAFLYLSLSVLFFCTVSCSRASSFSLEIPETEATAVPSGKTTTLLAGKKLPLYFWRFTPSQKNALASYFEQETGAALELTLGIKAGKALDARTSSIFFLYDDDFSGKNTLSRSRKSRPQVAADFSAASADGKPFSVLLCMGKDMPLPAGFSIASGEHFTVISARITEPCVGFDYTRSAPLYAFAPTGGILVPFSSSFDMSGVPTAFPPVHTASALMPTLTVTTVPGADVCIASGGERLTIRQSYAAGSSSGGASGESASSAVSASQASAAPVRFLPVSIPCAALKSPFSEFSVVENPQCVASALVHASDRDLLAVSANYPRAVLKPLLVDPGLIMEWRRATWRGRDYELFAWDRFPSVLIFDTASYAVQDDFFRRLAFFAEKAGYRGRLMDDSFLQTQHGYNAHDYRAETLAAFFELARTSQFPLNERELLLKEILSVNGIIHFAQDGTVLPGEGAVISLSQESAMYLRWTFIAHEGWHGIFFTDSEFRNTVASLYYTMDRQALQALQTYFSVTPTLNYDLSDDYLMKNEFMAYMLQRPLGQVREYYINLASRSHAQTRMKAEADYILATNADGYVSAATMLDEYVSGRWNLAAGRVWLINRQSD
ncbi:MAG: hypothetical protein K6G80_03975 [Treponema sp.]|nr:hypothetical protein [Treponema sp.]